MIFRSLNSVVVSFDGYLIHDTFCSGVSSFIPSTANRNVKIPHFIDELTLKVARHSFNQRTVPSINGIPDFSMSATILAKFSLPTFISFEATVSVVLKM